MRRTHIEELQGKKALMTASTGGHLTQLVRLAPQLGVTADSIWVTFDTPQSRSLLAGRDARFVPYVHPRDYRGIARAARLVRPWIGEVDAAVSTGAGVALAVLPQVALTSSIPVVYLESISRVRGPSTSGRILARLPRIGLYAQHPSWCSPPWQLGPSVLSDYVCRPRERRVPRRILVTLGTIAPYRFDRAVDEVLGFVRQCQGVEVTWQLDCTTRTELPGRVVRELPDADFAEAVATSDLVIAHSGVGVAMHILDSGRVPLLMARRAAMDEHVDDHQLQILNYLKQRGLALEAQEAFHDPEILDYALSHEVAQRRLTAPGSRS